MSIGRPDFGKVYTESQLRKLKAQNTINDLVQAEQSQNTQNNIEDNKNCGCQPKVWPAPYNPPAPPSVPPRPYPPQFYPLPQNIAVVTVDKNHTSAVINNCDSHEDIYHYVSGSTIRDINEACENTLISANNYTDEQCTSTLIDAITSSIIYTDIKCDQTLSAANIYTDNRFAYYDKPEEISGALIRERKIVRYRGKLDESLFSIKDSLEHVTYGFKDQVLINYHINNYQKYPKYHIFQDLKIGDLFIVPVSSTISPISNLADEYICTKASPISAAEFQKIGSNNIEDIEKYLLYLDQRITDQKNDVLSTINSVSTTLRDYTDQQINILEVKAAVSSVTAQNNAKSYAKTYTDQEIKKLGNVFNIKGFMLSASTAEQLAMTPYEYIKYRYQPDDPIHPTRYIAEQILSGLKNGDIYLTKEYQPISAVSEYLYLTSSTVYQDAVNPSNWQKLGTNSGYALSADVTKLVAQTSANTLDDAKYYTIQQINTLEIKTIASAAILSTNLINYTNDLVAVSTDFAITSAKNYTDIVSTEFASALTGRLIEELSGTFIYKGYAWQKDQKITPWRRAQVEISAGYDTFRQSLKNGQVFIVDEYVYESTDTGDVKSSIITAQYVYIANTEDRIYAASSEASWLKLGYKTNLDKYSTLKYVQDVVSASLTSTDIKLDNKIDITAANSSAYTQYVSGLLEASAAASAFKAEENANIYTNDLVAASTDFAITSAKNYTDIVSTEFASTLTGRLIEELSGTFIYKGFPDNEKFEDLYVTPWQYARKQLDVKTSAFINSLKTGQVYICKEDYTESSAAGTEIISTNIVEYVYIASTDDRKIAASSEFSWLKLGYTTNLGKYSTLKYVQDVVSASLASADIELDNKIDATAANASAYTQYVSGLLEASAAASANIVLSSAKVYIDQQIISAREDLSTYVEVTSSNIIKYISSGIQLDFDGMMKYAGYAHPGFPTEYPWQHAKHQDPEHDFLKYLYKGKVYIVKEPSYGTNDKGKVISSEITAQYMYIGQTSAVSSCAASSQYWLKLGQAIDLSTYSTLKYVQDVVSASLASTDIVLNNKIDTTAINASAYTQYVSGLLEASTAASAVKAEENANIYTNDLVSISTEFAIASAKTYTDIVSTYLEIAAAASANIALSSANVYTDQQIISARVDLSTYVEVTSSNIIKYISSGIQLDFDGMMKYAGYAHPGFPTEYPWQHAKHQDPEYDFLKYLYKGKVYIVKEPSYGTNDEGKVISSEITAQYMYIGQTSAVSSCAASSQYWLKLGQAIDLSTYSTIGYVNKNIISAREDLSGYVEKASGNAYDYTDNIVSGAREDLSAYVKEASGNAYDYTDNIVSSAREDLSAYVKEASGNAYNIVSSAREDLSAYVKEVSGNAYDYTDNIVSGAKEDLSAYVKEASGNAYDYTNNIVSGAKNELSAYTSASINNLGIVFNYKGYGAQNEKTRQPWTCPGINPKAGNIYLQDVIIKCGDINDQGIAEVAEYLYISGDPGQQTSYQKLGNAPLKNNYATSTYVNKVLGYVYTSAYNLVSGAREDLSAYVKEASDNAYTSAYNLVSGAREDLSTYIKEVSGNAYTYVDNKINGLGTVFRTKGYADPLIPSAFPWQVSISPSAGDVYLTDVIIKSGISGEAGIKETAEYLYLGKVSSIISACYQKLGNASLQNNYATVNYVDTKDIEISGLAHKQLSSFNYTEFTPFKNDMIVITGKFNENINDLIGKVDVDKVSVSITTAVTEASGNISNIISKTIQPEQLAQNNRLTNIENVISGQTNSLSGCLDGIINHTDTTLRTVSAYIENKKYLIEYQLLSTYYKKYEVTGYVTEAISTNNTSYVTTEINNAKSYTYTSAVSYISTDLIGNVGAQPGTDTVYANINKLSGNVYANINYIKIHELAKLSGFNSATDVKAYIDEKDKSISGAAIGAAADINYISSVIGKQITPNVTVFDEIKTLKEENTKLIDLIGNLSANISDYTSILNMINYKLNK